VSLFTLALISWALKKEHSDIPEQKAGQNSQILRCSLYPFRTLSVLPGYESCPQADTRTDKTLDGASDRTAPRLVCQLGEAE
jgi:hypothetical protein